MEVGPTHGVCNQLQTSPWRVGLVPMGGTYSGGRTALRQVQLRRAGTTSVGLTREIEWTKGQMYLGWSRVRPTWTLEKSQNTHEPENISQTPLSPWQDSSGSFSGRNASRSCCLCTTQATTPWDANNLFSTVECLRQKLDRDPVCGASFTRNFHTESIGRSAQQQTLRHHGLPPGL